MMMVTPYAGGIYQRGYGIGSIFRGLFRAALPIIKQQGKAIAKSVGRKAMKTGVRLASDALRGRDMGESVKIRLAQALHEAPVRKVKRGTTSSHKGRRGKASKKRRVAGDIFG